jgi:hypothetical protein
MVCGAVWNAPNPLNPVEDGGLVNRQSAFPPEFFHIALPHGVAPIPSHGTEDAVGVPVAPFKRGRIAQGRSPVLGGQHRGALCLRSPVIPATKPTKELSELLKNVTIYLDDAGHQVPCVFTYAGKGIGSVRCAFETACREVGITDMVFHDLRHTFVTKHAASGCRLLPYYGGHRA